MERRTQISLADVLDSRIRHAAWSKSGKVPNGELEGATFYWPPEVRATFGRLTRIARKIRRDRCECKGKKHIRACNKTLQRAKEELEKLKMPAADRDGIAETLAQYAHAKRIDDGSCD